MIRVQRIEHDGWAFGRVEEYRFQALISREPAVNPNDLLPDSKISSLGIRYRGQVVFHWDRAPIVEAVDAVVRDVVIRLCTELEAAMPFRPGVRIRLLEMNDTDPLPEGLIGTVTSFYRSGMWEEIEVDWDDGLQSCLTLPLDEVEIIG